MLTRTWAHPRGGWTQQIPPTLTRHGVTGQPSRVQRAWPSLGSALELYTLSMGNGKFTWLITPAPNKLMQPSLRCHLHVSTSRCAFSEMKIRTIWLMLIQEVMSVVNGPMCNWCLVLSELYVFVGSRDLGYSLVSAPTRVTWLLTL